MRDVSEDVSELRDIIARLERIEATMTTKADLEAVAKNVEIKALGRQAERIIAEGRALRGDLRLLISISNGIAVSVKGLIDHQMQLSERVSELEEEEPPR